MTCRRLAPTGQHAYALALDHDGETLIYPCAPNYRHSVVAIFLKREHVERVRKGRAGYIIRALPKPLDVRAF